MTTLSDLLATAQPQLDFGVLFLGFAMLVLCGVMIIAAALGRAGGRARDLVAFEQASLHALREAVARFDAAAFACRQIKTLLKRASDQDEKAETARLQGELAGALRELKLAESALLLLLDPTEPTHESLERTVGETVDATLSANASASDDLSSDLIETARRVLKHERERLKTAA